jgi:hypothetical protein
MRPTKRDELEQRKRAITDTEIKQRGVALSYLMRARMALVNSVVEALPPRSPVIDLPSAMVYRSTEKGQRGPERRGCSGYGSYLERGGLNVLCNEVQAESTLRRQISRDRSCACRHRRRRSQVRRLCQCLTLGHGPRRLLCAIPPPAGVRLVSEGTKSGRPKG